MLGIHKPALPASLRRTNERTVISLLLRLGTASRAQLAKAAGISQPTAGKIISRLLQLGVVQLAPNPEETRDQAPAKLGRPGEGVRLATNRPRFIAVELGVLETLVAALPFALPPQDEWVSRFPTPSGPKAWLGALTALNLPKSGIWGVLVSVPGIVDEPVGRVLFSPNLHWTESTSLPLLLKKLWRVPVLLVQEIRALALGYLAADPSTEDFLLVDFGQGVGGAIVLGGKLLSHGLPWCGELGHTPVPGNQRVCGCGATGCLETLLSERGLLASFAGHHSGTPSWTRFQASLDQGPLPAWLRKDLEHAAIIIAGALNTLGLRKVIVTGSLAQLPPAVLEYLHQHVRRGALCGRFGEVVCLGAPRRRAAGLAAAGFDHLVLPAHDVSGGRKLAPASKRPS